MAHRDGRGNFLEGGGWGRVLLDLRRGGQVEEVDETVPRKHHQTAVGKKKNANVKTREIKPLLYRRIHKSWGCHMAAVVR